jgi:CubicO group peptidase (beta-lactamase class C family)
MLGALPLLHQPGEVWEYSIGFDVLGRAIEVVTGQTFDEFLQSRLFAPLHMVDTGFSVPAEKLARLVAVPGTQPKPLSDGDVGKPQTFFSGGGGIVSKRSPTSCASARCCSTAASLTVRAF